MREQDLVYLLKHIDKNSEYSRHLAKMLHHAEKLIDYIQKEHILDGNEYKMAELFDHLEKALLLSCEICSGVPRSSYKSDETLEEYLKSKEQLEKLWRRPTHRPAHEKSSETETIEDAPFKQKFYKLAIEYLESTNISKVTISNVTKYIAANLYNVNIENASTTVFQVVKQAKGSSEADKFMRHVTDLYTTMNKFRGRGDKSGLISALKNKMGGE